MNLRLILLVGCAGSGKSTYAREQFPSAAVISADDYFEVSATSLGRSYIEVWEANALRAAHMRCHRLFQNAVEANAPLIVLDNTNVRARERQFYIKTANAVGYTVELHVFSPWRHGQPHPGAEEIHWYLDACHRRNRHGVPRETVEQQFRHIDLPAGIYLVGASPQFLGPVPDGSIRIE